MIFHNIYEPKELIGTGGFGIVYKVLDNRYNKFYALKLITKKKTIEIPKFKEAYEKEIEVMKNITNKYIIELIDNFYDEKNKSYCIVMELCDGNLKDILDKYKPKGLPLNIIKKIFFQLNDALKAMRKKNYIHRDLKPENILIKYTDENKIDFDIKLTDFGFTTKEINSSIHTFTNVGTKNYMAPEIENFNYNIKCDLWSLGVILYELYTNKYIFYTDNPKEIEINRKKGKILVETNNEMINKLIRKLIQVDINKRIKWEEYFSDQFFNYDNQRLEEIEDDGSINNLKEPIQYYDLIVYCNSFERLFDKNGWYYKYSQRYENLMKKLEEIKDDSFCSIGVLGESKIGKTFILNQISGETLPSGISKKTYGLSVKYFSRRNNLNKISHFYLYDTKGNSEPLIDENKKDIKNESKLIEKIDDIKTSEYLLYKFIQYYSNIIIIVVGQLTLSTQELIYNIKYERGKIDGKILIIHNLQYLYTLKDINKYIDNTLRKSIYNNLIKRKFSILDNENDNSEFYYFIENTTINNEYKEIIHLIMGNNNNKNSDCIELNKQTLKFIRDSIVEINVNNGNSLNIIKNIKKYIQDHWINKTFINEENNNIGHIFCKEYIDKRNIIGGIHKNFLSINNINYTYYIDNQKYFIIKIELSGANELNTQCDYVIKKERGNYKVEINIKKKDSIIDNKLKEYNIIFNFDESKSKIDFSKNKKHNIKNGIITITYFLISYNHVICKL